MTVTPNEALKLFGDRMNAQTAFGLNDRHAE